MSALLASLMEATGLPEHDIRRIVRNAPSRYKTYRVPKRTCGTREISQPARELKALQRVLMEEVLGNLPIHPAAMAYRKGMSIRSNAAAHAQNGPIRKYDFKDFFPSIRDHDWREYCRESGVFASAEDVYLSTQILFQRRPGVTTLRLAIGAPSSPLLSNILMYRFDSIVSELVKIDHVTYTRYADDLTFSAKRTGFLNSVDRALRKALREVPFPRLQINEAKTVSATPKYKRLVTGLILTNDHKVSIGHERKRRIRAAVHYAQQGKLSAEELRQLAGFLAFAYDVEPEFVERLNNRYGTALMETIRSAGQS